MNQWKETNSEMSEILESVKWSRFYLRSKFTSVSKNVSFLFEEISMSCLVFNESVERDKLGNGRNFKIGQVV